MAKEAIRDQSWTFRYKRGNAPMEGKVKASTEELGYRVAVRWCELNGVRPPAKVFPEFLADESILETTAPAAVEGLVDPVGSTSKVLA